MTWMLHDDIAVSWSEYIVIIYCNLQHGRRAFWLACFLCHRHSQETEQNNIRNTKNIALTHYCDYNHCALEIEHSNIKNTKDNALKIPFCKILFEWIPGLKSFSLDKSICKVCKHLVPVMLFYLSWPLKKAREVFAAALLTDNYLSPPNFGKCKSIFICLE